MLRQFHSLLYKGDLYINFLSDRKANDYFLFSKNNAVNDPDLKP